MAERNTAQRVACCQCTSLGIRDRAKFVQPAAATERMRLAYAGSEPLERKAPLHDRTGAPNTNVAPDRLGSTGTPHPLAMRWFGSST